MIRCRQEQWTLYKTDKISPAYLHLCFSASQNNRSTFVSWFLQQIKRQRRAFKLVRNMKGELHNAHREMPQEQSLDCPGRAQHILDELRTSRQERSKHYTNTPFSVGIHQASLDTNTCFKAKWRCKIKYTAEMVQKHRGQAWTITATLTKEHKRGKSSKPKLS